MELSSRKKVSNHNKTNKTDLLKVYRPHINNSKRQKMKISNHNKTNDAQAYQFPQFAIVFKDTGKGPKFKSCINNQIQCSKVDNSASTQRKIQTKTKTREYARKVKIVTSKKQKKISEKSFSNFTFKDKSHDEIKCPLQKQYLKCVQTVFNILDIFNKGKISQANINKWLPEPALYFLGTVFQRMRIERLYIDRQEFKKLCCRLLNETSTEDVKWFIQQMQSISSVKKSINLSQTQVIGSLTNEKRSIEVDHKANSYKQQPKYKNVPYQEIISLIKKKEAETSQKINEASSKRKSVSFNILQQRNTNQQQEISHRDGLMKKSQNSSFINISKDLQGEENSIDVKKSILKKSFKQPEPTISKNLSRKIFNVAQMENHGVPNFTFHLPQLPQENNQNKLQKSQIDVKFQQIYNKYKGKLANDKKQQLYQPFSARYQSSQPPSFQPEKITHTFRQNAEEDNKRLDDLKNRIEGFLKDNAQKIQNNKSFYLESCSKYQSNY